MYPGHDLNHCSGFQLYLLALYHLLVTISFLLCVCKPIEILNNLIKNSLIFFYFWLYLSVIYLLLVSYFHLTWFWMMSCSTRVWSAFYCVRTNRSKLLYCILSIASNFKCLFFQKISLNSFQFYSLKFSFHYAPV